MGALETPRMTVEQYLAAEEVAELPSEFHDGEVLPIEGASPRHALISVGLGGALLTRLKGTKCMPFGTVRVRITVRDYVYPDLAVACGDLHAIDKAGSIENPTVIFEVLSPSTKGYDHADKFKLYRKLATFEEYVLVSQDEPYVEVFRKQADNTWVFSTHQGLDASFELKSLQVSIPLAEVYANVTWEGEPHGYDRGT